MVGGRVEVSDSGRMEIGRTVVVVVVQWQNRTSGKISGNSKFS